MNKEKINAGIDRMAEEAKETMNLLSDKIDRATRCGNEKAARCGSDANRRTQRHGVRCRTSCRVGRGAGGGGERGTGPWPLIGTVPPP